VVILLLTLRVEQNLHVIFVFQNHHFKFIVYKYILSGVEFIILRAEDYCVLVGDIVQFGSKCTDVAAKPIYNFSPFSTLKVVVAG
jgi:hypothetical protein